MGIDNLQQASLMFEFYDKTLNRRGFVTALEVEGYTPEQAELYWYLIDHAWDKGHASCLTAKREEDYAQPRNNKDNS